MAYITQDDVLSMFTPSIGVQLFDDDGDGIVDPDDVNIALVIERAHAEVESYVENLYVTRPTNTPVLLKSCALDYAYAYSLDRRPELAKAYSEESTKRWARAEKRMDRIQKSTQRLIDNVPTGDPANVGGVVRSGNPDDTALLPKWFTDGLGDF